MSCVPVSMMPCGDNIYTAVESLMKDRQKPSSKGGFKGEWPSVRFIYIMFTQGFLRELSFYLGVPLCYFDANLLPHLHLLGLLY